MVKEIIINTEVVARFPGQSNGKLSSTACHLCEFLCCPGAKTRRCPIKKIAWKLLDSYMGQAGSCKLQFFWLGGPRLSLYASKQFCEYTDHLIFLLLFCNNRVRQKDRSSASGLFALDPEIGQTTKCFYLSQSLTVIDFFVMTS